MAALLDAFSTSLILALLARVTLLLVVVWVFHLVLQAANPRWRVWLWRATFVGLAALPILVLLLPSWQVNVAMQTERDAVAHDTDGNTSATTLEPAPESTAITSGVPLALGRSELDGAAAPAVSMVEISSKSTPWRMAAVSIWSGVAGLLSLLLLWNLVQVRKIVRCSEPAAGDVVEIARQAMRNCDLIRFPEIRVSSSFSVPFASGIFRPIVIVPAEMARFEADELRPILTHELAHIAGKDVPWTVCALLIRNVLWFHPLVWRLPAVHQLACETVCDALACQCNASREVYRRILAKLALETHRRELSRTGVVMSATAEVTRRLRLLASNIPNSRIPLHRRVALAGLGCIGMIPVATVSLTPISVASEPRGVVAQEETTEAVATEKQAKDGTWTVRLRAVDADTGNPISNPQFVVQLGQAKTRYDGNEAGELAVQIPSRTPTYCYLIATADGYTPMRGFWGNRSFDTRDELPEQLTFSMTPGITVGGVVRNERMQPVEGATVLFSASANQPEQRLEQTFWDEPYITDEQGRWKCTIAPRDMNGGSISVNHPGYARVTSNWSVDSAIEALKAGEYEWILKDGFVVRGVVTQPDGAPIAGAHLAVGMLNIYSSQGPFAVTDAKGRYEFQRVGVGTKSESGNEVKQLSVTVLCDGWAPQMAVVPGTGKRELGNSTAEERVIDFQLDKGKPLTILLLDSQNNPIKDAWIFPSEWRDGTDGLTVLREHGIPQATDKTGVWRWATAPAGERIAYDILKSGFMDVRRKWLVAGEKHAITLSRPQVLIGKVVDADTKQPIDEFVIQKGFEGMNSQDYPEGVWWTAETQGRNGQYRRVVTMPKKSYRWRFLAEGYQSFSSKSIPVTEDEVVLDVELKKIPR